jgi:hypothetical protein
VPPASSFVFVIGGELRQLLGRYAVSYEQDSTAEARFAELILRHCQRLVRNISCHWHDRRRELGGKARDEVGIPCQRHHQVRAAGIGYQGRSDAGSLGKQVADLLRSAFEP